MIVLYSIKNMDHSRRRLFSQAPSRRGLGRFDKVSPLKGRPSIPINTNIHAKWIMPYAWRWLVHVCGSEYGKSDTWMCGDTTMTRSPLGTGNP